MSLPDPDSSRGRAGAGRKGAPAATLAAFAAAAVLVRWLYLALTGLTFEDALISLRYAENFAAGLGLVYNPGERVFGASTPLYVLFLGGLARAGLPALGVARLLAAIADGLTLFLWCRWLQRAGYGFGAAALFALLFGLSSVCVQVSISGMETSFALLLLTVALTRAIGSPSEGARPAGAVLGLALGGLMLVRPEGVLVAGLALAAERVRTGRLPWVPAVTAAAVVLPWVVAATLYYGSPIPNSIPAKAAAYNLHRTSFWPNLFGLLPELLPTRGPAGRLVAAAVIGPLLLVGLWEGLRAPRRPGSLFWVAALFLLWLAYLVLPRTLIFTWYFPPLLLPAYVVAAAGFGTWRAAAPGVRGAQRLACAVLAAGLVGHLGYGIWAGRRLQEAEREVRRAIGLWLREHTPPEARVALEPIGYIGYYSRRRILDEVGLVSPEMIPLNRAGAGWFGAMLRRFRPEYVVERPTYLLRNRTLNSGVPMFLSAEERSAFLAEYEAVAAFAHGGVPEALRPNYSFVIYARRDAKEARRWRAWMAALPPDERARIEVAALTGPLPAPAGRRDAEPLLRL